MSWHYFATRLNGDGTEDILATELPLQGVEPRKALSAPDELGNVSIPVEVARLKGSGGRPIFLPWSTAIYAEHDGVIRFGGILTDMTLDDQAVQLTVEGFTAYPHGMPYDGQRAWIQADPLDIVRHIWANLQSYPGGNLGMVLDNTTSPVRIGTEERDVEFDTRDGEHVEFTAGPYKLSYYETHDLGRVIDDLAESTPFDYEEVHTWNGDTIRHRLRLGYPRLGRRRQDLRFVVGENVVEVPSVEFSGDEYANEVTVLGAGEGSAMVTHTATKYGTGRLRRRQVIVDKSRATVQAARALAEAELRARLGSEDVTSFVVYDHPNAPVGSWEVGDEVLLRGSGTGWAGDLEVWVRILDFTYATERDFVTVNVTRAERTTSV